MKNQALTQMSPFAYNLYQYGLQYVKKTPFSLKRVDRIAKHFAGRAVTFGCALLAHAEMVYRAVYFCFLKIKELFSRFNDNLLQEQKKWCCTAFQLSFRSFLATFFSQGNLTNWNPTKEKISHQTPHFALGKSLPDRSPILSPRATEIELGMKKLNTSLDFLNGKIEALKVSIATMGTSPPGGESQPNSESSLASK